MVTLLPDLTEYYPCFQIAIQQCWNNGINCKVHSLIMVGKRRLSSQQLPLTMSFLASDYEEAQVGLVCFPLMT